MMNIGYRVVSYSLKDLECTTLMNKLPVDLTQGSVLSSQDGIFLGTSEDFCEYYTGSTDDHDVILTYEYEGSDILRGDSLSPGSEVLVKQARLTDARFDDEFMQDYYGYLLNDGFRDRLKERGQVLDTNPHKKVFLIRTMPEQADAMLPMDYAYLLDGRISESTVRRVLRDYEEGDKPASQRGRALMKTLEHAVTSAIYQGNPYRIVVSAVPASDAFQATNAGEYFYGGDKPVSGETIMMIDSDGIPSRPVNNDREWGLDGP